MVLLGIVAWIVVGLVVGFIASRMVDLHGDDVRLGMFVAVGGAVLAAAIYTFVSGAGIGGWRPWSLIWGAAGGALGAAIWHGVRSRYVSRARYTTRSSY